MDRREGAAKRRERVLARDGAAVELNARYFDALALMVAEAGALISKDRFLGEVWSPPSLITRWP